MKPEEKQLPIPPEAKTDPASAELLRAWVANNGLHCTMNLGCWGDDEAVVWGILLSDVARHVADALEKDRGLANADTIGKIRAHFNHELDAPTAETRGDFN